MVASRDDTNVCSLPGRTEPGPTTKPLLTIIVVGETLPTHARRDGHRRPRRRRVLPRPHPRPPPRGARRARLRDHAGAARRAPPPEGELPPPGARAPRPRRAR